MGESAAIYVADDLINEQAQIAVFDPKVSQVQIQ
jgi:UDPglucose 6-dehydrogenase